MSELQQQAAQPPSLWHNNPVLVQLLGLSPLLAVSNTLVNGIGLGVATLIVLTLSCLTASLVRHYINYTWRFVWFLLITATFTTLVDSLMQWFYFSLYRELGIYVPLICCNFVILIRMETCASVSPWNVALRDAALVGAGFILVLLSLAAAREFRSYGSVLNQLSLLMPSSAVAATTSTDLAGVDSSELFTFARLQPAALILLGLAIAFKNVLDSKLSKSPAARTKPRPARRARVTGRI